MLLNFDEFMGAKRDSDDDDVCAWQHGTNDPTGGWMDVGENKKP